MDLDYVRQFGKRHELHRLAGGKCSKCGELDTACMTFHHTNPNEKEDLLSKLYDCRFSDALHEANKCILLCQNCHRDLHTSTSIGCRQKNKLRLLNAVNKHSCEKCGYCKNELVLGFHHIDASSKKFSISNEIMNTSNVLDHIEEANKCTVLCGNCHSKEHFDYVKYHKHYEMITEYFSKYVEKRPKVDEAEVLRLHSEKVTGVEIAKILNTAKSTISGILKKHGLGRDMKDIMVDDGERTKIKKLFLENVTVKNIAKSLNRNVSTVSRVTKELQHKHGKRHLDKGFNISKTELEKHIENKLSNRAIAKIYGCSNHVIKHRILEYGINK